MTNAPLLLVRNLAKTYRAGGRQVAALADVSLSVAGGETLGIVGASGSGKSTLARVLLRLVEPDGGAVTFAGGDWLALGGSRLRAARQRMQMVFQDPLAAFNPRATVADAVAAPLAIHAVVPRAAMAGEVARLLGRVGLPADYAARSILALSGGERQRVAIARALAPRPSLVVLDEAVSALDVVARARILELIVALQRDSGVSYLFISHDIAAVRAVSQSIAVMDAGRIVETGPAADVVAAPRSAAGRALVAAVPRLATTWSTRQSG